MPPPPALCALIPAFRPDGKLVTLAKAIAALNFFAALVIVDDGSGPDYALLFEELSRISSVIVLRHAINLGKGAALKTGINQILVQFASLVGVVTADADGQHAVEDIRKIGESLIQHPNQLVLGCRQFEGAVPLRSRFGNTLTRGIFAAVIGRHVSDTQTGLRGIPQPLMREVLTIKSNHYEFEMDMMILAAQYRQPFVEEKIETIYLDNNSASHFNPILDSTRIYFCLLRFAFSSSASALIDLALFAAILSATGSVLAAQSIARACSACVNYFMVRDIVFEARQQRLSPAIAYAIVAIFSGMLSYLAQIALMSQVHMPPLAAKILVETVMFFANFSILRSYVFVQKDMASKIIEAPP